MNTWDKLSMTEKAEIMKLAVDGGIYDLDTIKDVYNKFAEGGQKEDSSWTMEDEAKYREWRNSLPDNLRNTDDRIYDMRGAYKAGMQPSLEADGYYHLQSRDPRTGRILKSSLHSTYLQALTEDARMGYYPTVDNKGNTYTQTWEGNERNSFAHGGEMGNYYDGWGDAWNFLKRGVQKARQKVKDWGLDKSPAAHLSERLEKSSKDIKDNRNPEFSNGTTALLDVGRLLGLNSTIKGSDNDMHYRQNLYNLVDPTNVIPESMGDYLDYANIVRHAKSDKDYKYRRVRKDPTADAAWAKRLELPYDSTLLISNPDGSVHLSEQLENEIPTDTTFIKQRIADNNRLLKSTYGPKRGDIEAALSIDSVALDNLRHTYRTGEPVEMNEFSHNSRNLRTNNETSPLNILHRYTLQYNPGDNTMGYRDTYNFDGLEDYVPGKPFEIKGTIDLKKKKK